VGRLVRRIERRYYRLRLRERARPANRLPFAEYRDDPAKFAREVLGIGYLWDKQEEAGRLLLEPPYRVMCPAANETGKTFWAAAVVLWWFCTRTPAIVITTAPTFKQVKDLLWKEIRRLARRARKRLGLPFLPKDCRIERAEDDFATGITATDATSFQGHHGPSLLFIIDEAVGVDAEFFEAIESMFSPPGHALFAIYNPTDVTSQIHREYRQATGSRGGKTWHVVRMAAADHPNVVAELKGQPAPIPHAIRLATFERRLHKWCQLVAGEPKATDIQWPPAWATDYVARTGQSPRWYRPGPVAEARLLGRFPSQSVYSVWSDGDWQAACREGLEPLEVPKGVLPEIGVDVARFGDDDTAFHVRCGPCSVDHEQFNGQDTNATVARVRELCREWAQWAGQRCPFRVSEFDIPVKVDDSGVGGGVVDRLRVEGYAVAGIDAGTKAVQSDDYPRRRDELWFTVAEMARRGELDLSRLADNVRDRLQAEAMAPKYSLDASGRRLVEPKDKTKKELGRSPDGMDAVGLCFAHVEGLIADDDFPSVGMRMRR
jgi:hypothetical protein